MSEVVTGKIQPRQTLSGSLYPRGNDGFTPYIGENGNWWIGSEDTGAPAANKLPLNVTLTNTTCSHSAREIYEAWNDGRLVRAYHSSLGTYLETVVVTENVVLFKWISSSSSKVVGSYQFQVDNNKQVKYTQFRHETPTKLPNPNAITFTGAVEATYDGSEAVTVEIPEGGGESAFVVNAAYDSVYETTTIDKTSAEIETAYKSGKNVICEFNNDGIRMILQPVFITNFASFFYGMYENTLTTVELLHGELNIVVTRYTTQAELEAALGEISLALDTMLPKDELDSAINAALAKAKASGEFNGADGQNGADGYTPVRGTDYWTEADKAEIKGYVDTAILGGAW